MRENTKYDVIGIGVSAIDVISLVEEFPENEGVQKALDSTIQGGGPIATAIVTLAKLDARVAMIDVIGDDWRGDLILREFEQSNVSTEFITIAHDHTSAVAMILVRRKDGARSIVFSPGSASGLDPIRITPEIIASAKIIHMNGRHLPECLEACRIARDNGVLTSFDGGAHRFRPELKQLIPHTDICIVAQNFAEAFTGRTDILSAGKEIIEKGPRIAGITDGLNGSWIFEKNGESFHQPACEIHKVVDTTGCGDSYHGAFLYGLIKGMDLKKTGSFAAAVAAINCSSLGGRAGLPGIEEVNEFLAEREQYK